MRASPEEIRRAERHRQIMARYRDPFDDLDRLDRYYDVLTPDVQGRFDARMDEARENAARAGIPWPGGGEPFGQAAYVRPGPSWRRRAWESYAQRRGIS